MPDVLEPIIASRSPHGLARDLVLGCSGGLLIGLVATKLHLMLGASGNGGVALADYVILWPVLGLVAAYFKNAGAAPAFDDASEASQGRWDRRRGRFVITGFAIGLALALITASIDVALRGWFTLPYPLILRLLVYPYIGVLIGFNLSRAPGEPRWSWRFTRFNMRTMMMLIAYVALLFGLGVEAERIGSSARRYHQQYLIAKEAASRLGESLQLTQAQARARLQNAETLRRGAIPANIPQFQQALLKSLDADAKVRPEDRERQYNQIADYEESQGRLAETGARQNAIPFDYFSELAAKYDKAQREPWLAVAPDKPRP
jgi:hypothetical protein